VKKSENKSDLRVWLLWENLWKRKLKIVSNYSWSNGKLIGIFSKNFIKIRNSLIFRSVGRMVKINW
jgi:hypothetical protein